MQPRRFTHGTIAHLAINSDDVEKSKAFYETLFGWRFHAWGPSKFFQIETPEGWPIAALQGRRELIPGVRTVGFECTVAVDDVHATVKAARELGARVLMEPVTIPTVCTLAFLEDPGGAVVGVAQYIES